MAPVETKGRNPQSSHTSNQFEGVGIDSPNTIKTVVSDDRMQYSVARITEIDISGPARALRVLRWSDYPLVIVCGLWSVGTLLLLVADAISGEWADLVAMAAMTGVIAFSAYTGWRHVGVIDQGVWRSYLYAFMLLTGLCVFVSLGAAVIWLSQGKPIHDLQPVVAAVMDNPKSISTAWALALILGVSIPGFVCVLLLRRMRIDPMGVRLVDLLSSLTKCGGISGLQSAKIQRAGVGRGLAYGSLGVVLLVGTSVVPNFLDIQNFRDNQWLRLIQPLQILGCFLFIRARRYFQVNAESLLTVDKRPPILFLRSFSDDEKQRYGSSQRALLDFSLETRLANHFYRFGPFIAIGSPTESVPLPGAARVLLRDDEWQSHVLGWMKEANLIIMYSGTTEWVNWELRKVIESGRSTSLILMFPEIKGWRPSRRKRDILARVEHIREVYQDTPWNEELTEYRDFTNLRAMLFREDGSMVMIKSRSRSRDSYHLAALIAHYQLLNPTNNSSGASTPVDKNGRRWSTVLAWTLAALTVLGTAFYWLGSDHENRLTFKQGELYYSETVTQTDARNVGEYLVRQHVFTDEKSVTVKLSQEQGRYRFGIVIDPTHAEKVLTALQFSVMGNDISREILSGKPIDVELYDPNLKLLKALPASAILSYGKGELYYTAPIGISEAQALGDWLTRNGYFTEKKATAVHFSREQGVYQLRFVIDPSRVVDPQITDAFVDPQITDAFIELSRAIAKQILGGEALMVHLCDGEFNTLKSERVEPRPGKQPGQFNKPIVVPRKQERPVEKQVIASKPSKVAEEKEEGPTREIPPAPPSSPSESVALPQNQATPVEKPVATSMAPIPSPAMIRISPGSFMMGDIQKVQFTKPFAIARYETTFDEYDPFAQAMGRQLPDDKGWGRGSRPVINVSWHDAKDYAQWLSQQTGKRYRLPMEAEWEYAARSDGNDQTWSGTSDESQLKLYAVHGTESTEPVGSKQPNGLGLYDMTGNVSEWVEDCWHEDYNGTPTYDSTNGGYCANRVFRGGSFESKTRNLRTSYRNGGSPTGIGGYGVGFRLAQDLP